MFALGDAAGVSADARGGGGERLPPTAQVAFQQADYLAWNLWASLNGKPLLPFRYQARTSCHAVRSDCPVLTFLRRVVVALCAAGGARFLLS